MEGVDMKESLKMGNSMGKVGRDGGGGTRIKKRY